MSPDTARCLPQAKPPLAENHCYSIERSRAFVLDTDPDPLLHASSGNLDLFHPCRPQFPFWNMYVVTVLSQKVVVELNLTIHVKQYILKTWPVSHCSCPLLIVCMSLGAEPSLSFVHRHEDNRQVPLDIKAPELIT